MIYDILQLVLARHVSKAVFCCVQSPEPFFNFLPTFKSYSKRRLFFYAFGSNATFLEIFTRKSITTSVIDISPLLFCEASQTKPIFLSANLFLISNIDKIDYCYFSEEILFKAFRMERSKLNLGNGFDVNSISTIFCIPF